MKLYTRTGDKGKTRIIGSHILMKNDSRVNAYGEIDELNSWVGYLRSLLDGKTKQFDAELEEIQQVLFDCGTDLATPDGEPNRHYLVTDDQATKWLEKKIDQYSAAVPAVKRFILPGGTQVASAFHVARTITRRAERSIVALAEEKTINDRVLVFVNRLSDYFFAAARYANFLAKKKDVLYRNSKDVFKLD